MTHHFICNHCKYENKVNVSESDRGTYQIQHGNFKGRTCISCFRKERTHINEIYGKVSFNMVLLGFILSLIIALILLHYSRSFILFSCEVIGLPVLIFLYENNLVKTFNHYRIKKK
jgi:hypothetical protein